MFKTKNPFRGGAIKRNALKGILCLGAQKPLCKSKPVFVFG